MSDDDFKEDPHYEDPDEDCEEPLKIWKIDIRITRPDGKAMHQQKFFTDELIKLAKIDVFNVSFDMMRCDILEAIEKLRSVQ